MRIMTISKRNLNLLIACLSNMATFLVDCQFVSVTHVGRVLCCVIRTFRVHIAVIA